MKTIVAAITFCMLWAFPAHAIVLDDMINDINKQRTENIVTPQTTEELKHLFKDASTSYVPRIFVDKLPADFAKEGNQQLYAQVIGALILRENEKTLRDKVIINLLKTKYDNKEPWTQTEQNYFALLVNKYDVIAKKTVDTQLKNLLQKADEVPVGLAVAQSVYDTDWGKKNMDSPYGQTGWLDEKRYENLKFDSLIKATESYVNEMNATPNYFLWRISRQNSAFRGSARKQSYSFAMVLRTYRPEDPIYTSEIRKLILQHPFLSKMDNLNFLEDDPK